MKSKPICNRFRYQWHQTPRLDWQWSKGWVLWKASCRQKRRPQLSPALSPLAFLSEELTHSPLQQRLLPMKEIECHFNNFDHCNLTSFSTQISNSRAASDFIKAQKFIWFSNYPGILVIIIRWLRNSNISDRIFGPDESVWIMKNRFCLPIKVNVFARYCNYCLERLDNEYSTPLGIIIAYMVGRIKRHFWWITKLKIVFFLALPQFPFSNNFGKVFKKENRNSVNSFRGHYFFKIGNCRKNK